MPEHVPPPDTTTWQELHDTVKPGQKWGAVIGGLFVDGVGPPEVPPKVVLVPSREGRRAAARASPRPLPQPTSPRTPGRHRGGRERP